MASNTFYESFSNYIGLDQTLDDNVVFFLREGTVDYPSNQEFDDPYGKKYKFTDELNQSEYNVRDDSFKGNVYTHSLNDVLTGTLTLNNRFYKTSYNEEDITNCLYFGGPKNLDSASNIFKNWIDIDGSKMSANKDLFIPWLVYKVSEILMSHQYNISYCCTSDESTGVIVTTSGKSIFPDGKKMLGNKDLTSIDRFINYMLGYLNPAAGIKYPSGEGKTAYSIFTERHDDSGTSGGSGNNSYQGGEYNSSLDTQSGISIDQIKFYKTSALTKDDSKLGRIINFTLSLNCVKNDVPESLKILVYLDPDDYYNSHIGSDTASVVWTFTDTDDPSNTYYKKETYSENRTLTESAPYRSDKYVVKIDSDELTIKVINGLLNSGDKYYSRHKKVKIVDIDRRLFGSFGETPPTISSEGEKIHLRTESEKDYTVKQRFFIFHSLDNENTMNISGVIYQKIRDYIINIVKDSRNYTDFQMYVDTDGASDWVSETGSLNVMNIVNYIYGILDTSNTVHIRPVTDFVSETSSNTPQQSFAFNYITLNNRCGSQSNGSPFYTPLRGTRYEIIYPSLFKNMFNTSTSGTINDNKFTTTMLQFPMIAYVVLNSGDTISPLVNFIQGYVPKVFENLAPTTVNGSMWSTDIRPSDQFALLVSYAAAEFSGASATRVITDEFISSVNATDPDISLNRSVSSDGTTAYYSFRINSTIYYVINKGIGSI